MAYKTTRNKTIRSFSLDHSVAMQVEILAAREERPMSSLVNQMLKRQIEEMNVVN